MEIVVQRNQFTKSSTIGDLSIDGDHQCVTLEPPTPPAWPATPKGKWCHPLGKYQITMSPNHGEVWGWMRKLVPDIDKFGLPLISNIEGEKYEDWITEDDGINKNGVDAERCVYIHIGNTAADTLGCLLTGLSESVDRINMSTDAFIKIFLQIIKAEDITIEFIEDKE